jgi:hypothetical protein
VFDLLNSRNPLAKGFKAPLQTANQPFWRPFVEETKKYLQGLKLRDGTRVCESNRKVGPAGLSVSLMSFCYLFDSLVACSHPPLKYLLGYKFSQDHLELFFVLYVVEEAGTILPQLANSRLLISVLLYISK